ncbi:unnamed protein product [Durusdinium trenchii]|uniref:Uncharacterized protein n=2 Tax=Durusdinium trenchii TaxID=1381693 RepID=A0ABP0MZW8_9DINO
MGQTACIESMCQAKTGAGDTETSGDPQLKSQDEKALPRLLGDSARSVDKTVGKEAAKDGEEHNESAEGAMEDRVIGQVESATSVGGSKEDQDEGHTSKALRKLERAEARKQVLPFLLQNGFQTVKSKKTWFWRSYYPLHAAVKKKDIETVRLLLTAGADPQKLNNKSETPQQLAERLNRSGSYQEIIEVLQNAKVRKAKSSRSRSLSDQGRSGTTQEVTPRGI